MWVYRRVDYFAGMRAQTRYDVGYVATRDGEEYGTGAYFHAVESFYGDQAKDQARREVHYLNGGTF